MPPAAYASLLACSLRLDFGPGVAQRYGAVKYQFLLAGVGIHTEVANALKLIAAFGYCMFKADLSPCIRHHLQRLGIQKLVEVAALVSIGIGFGEKTIIESHFAGH